MLTSRARMVACLLLTALAAVAGHQEAGGGHMLLEAGSGTEVQAAAGRGLFQRFAGHAMEKKEGLIGGVAFGFLLWCICPIALFNNERISVKQAKMRMKAERHSMIVEDNSVVPAKEMVGKIIYAKGESECTAKLKDDVFSAVTTEGKIKLRRIAMMYQWVESSHEEGEGDNKRTVYTYSQQWCDSQQPTRFENDPSDSAMSWSKTHTNPTMPFSSTSRQEVENICSISGSGPVCAEAEYKHNKLGAYYLGYYVVREMHNWHDKDVTSEQLSRGWNSKTPFKHPEYDTWWYYSESDSKSAGSPQTGDVRVKFETLDPGPITLCGVLAETLTGFTFVPITKKEASMGESLFAEMGRECCTTPETVVVNEENVKDPDWIKKVKNLPEELDDEWKKKFKLQENTKMMTQDDDDTSDMCCGSGPLGFVILKAMHFMGMEDELLAVKEEQKDLHSLIEDERADAQAKTTAMRAIGFFCLLFATWCIISPIMSLLNYNIFVTMLGGGLISCLLCCSTMLCTMMAYSCIVSCAWLYYRPLMGVLGLLLAGACGAGMFYCLHYVYEQRGEQAAGGSVGPTFLALRGALSALQHRP